MGTGGFFLTDIQTSILKITKALRENAGIPIEDWPSNVPFSPFDMGLVELSGRLYLPTSIDFLVEELIERELPGIRCRIFEAVGSTNSEMLKAAARTNIQDLLYLAEFQYGGRGRHGRVWYSPYGRNLSVSYGLETKLSQKSISCLSLVVGLAIADELTSLGIEGVKIKWPNDIFISDKKLAGILVELMEKPELRAVVIGFGLNLEITSEERLKIEQPVTDLKTLGISIPRNLLVARLIKSIKLYIGEYFNKGFDPIKLAYEKKLAFRGELCELVSGGKILDEGVLLGINSLGEIEIKSGNLVNSYSIGEVSVKRMRSSLPRDELSD